MAAMPEPGPFPAGTPTIAIPLDGMAVLPDGVLPAIVTFMQMLAAPRLPDAAAPPATERLAADEVARFRRLFVEVGTPWLWTSRLRHTDGMIAERLADPGIATLAVVGEDGSDVGLVELDLRRAGEVEIVLFGFVPAAVGRGLGRRLMTDLLARAWARRGLRRVWLHTCTLDHPAAPAFYRSFGFRAYRRAVEIVPDPRRDGLVASDVAPDWPLVG
jgi:GNAT superfamily N-acetyltransferase